MIYEIRVYEATEGNADAMRRRFLDVVATRFFPRHGIELLGAFTALAIGAARGGTANG